MKAGTIRKLARDREVDELQRAIDALIEGEDLPFEVQGEDEGEQLTHCNLALRIRQRVDAGEPLKDVFRDVMGQVRGLLENEA